MPLPHDAVIRVYDDVGNVIATHEHKGELNNDSSDHLCAVCAINDKIATAGPRPLAAAPIRFALHIHQSYCSNGTRHPAIIP